MIQPVKLAKTMMKRSMTLVKGHTPEILMVVGTGAFAATVVMAVEASPKAAERYEEARYEAIAIQGKPRKIAHVVAKTAPAYIPTALMGATALTCFFGAHRIQVRRQLALASAYSMLSQTLNTYQDKVIEEFGEEKHLSLLDKVLGSEEPLPDVGDDPSMYEGEGDTLCYDRVTGRYFKSTPEKIREAEGKVAKRMVDEMCVPLNALYEELGLEDNSFIGDAIGWDVQDARIDIVFRSTLDESNRPCLVLMYKTMVIDQNALRL